MKSLLIIGAFLGFVLGVDLSLIQQESWPICLGHGLTAAFLASLLLPWQDRAWSRNPEVAQPDRQNAPDVLLFTSTQPKTSKS
jgi:hypothetical protein